MDKPNTDHASPAGDDGHIELLQAPPLAMTPDALLHDLNHYFSCTLGRRTVKRRSIFLYEALVYTIRDRLMERWNRTNIALERANARRAHYLSMEFLMGRLLGNAMFSLGSEDASSEALASLGVDIASVIEAEHDAGLGRPGQRRCCRRR